MRENSFVYNQLNSSIDLAEKKLSKHLVYMMVCARIILIDLPFSMILRVFPNENQRNITIQRFRSFLFLEHSNMIGIGFSICSSRFPSSLPTH